MIMRQTKSYNPLLSETLTTVISVVSFLLISFHTISASPVLSEINIQSGNRGIAVSFSADAPFRISFSGNDNVVTAHLKECIYGLQEFSYNNFPSNSPLKNITATEKQGSSTEIIFEFKQPATLPVKTIQKQNQWIVLISDRASPQFSWKNTSAATTPSAASEKPALSPAVAHEIPQPTQSARLENVRLLQRGLISKLTFDFNREVSCAIQRKESTVLLIVENCQNSITDKMLKLPDNSVFRHIAFSSEILDGIPVTTATVTIDSDSKSDIASTQGSVVSIYSIRQNNKKATVWTSVNGLTLDYKFYDVPSYAIDMNSMSNRAIQDAARRLRMDNTFSITEPDRKADVPSEPSPVVEVPTPTKQNISVPENNPVQIVTTNNVRVRSAPSLNGNVIGKVSQGDRISVSRELRNWKEVSVNGKTGFISSRFLVDSKPPTSPEMTAPVAQTKSPVVLDTPEPQLTRVSTAPLSREPQKDSLISGLLTRADTTPLPPAKRVIHYNPRGPDPFKPIHSNATSLTGLPFVDHLSLVGVLYDDVDRIALCEDIKNGRRPFAFREHDRVEKGKVLKIYPDKVVFLITEYGISRSFTLQLSTEIKQEASKQ